MRAVFVLAIASPLFLLLPAGCDDSGTKAAPSDGGAAPDARSADRDLADGGEAPDRRCHTPPPTRPRPRPSAHADPPRHRTPPTPRTRPRRPPPPPRPPRPPPGARPAPTPAPPPAPTGERPERLRDDGGRHDAELAARRETL